jgi:hypothetical protein
MVNSLNGFTSDISPSDNFPSDLPEIRITSHKNGDYVHPSPELTIEGTSSDTVNTNCTILTSINYKQPFQEASGTGPQGTLDLSHWNSTFLNAADSLSLGKNTITSLIFCSDGNRNIYASSLNQVNLTHLSNGDNQSRSSISNEIHNSLGNEITKQEKGPSQSKIVVQNNPNEKSIPTNRHSSKSQSTESPNSGQSTIENP